MGLATDILEPFGHFRGFLLMFQIFKSVWYFCRLFNDKPQRGRCDFFFYSKIENQISTKNTKHHGINRITSYCIKMLSYRLKKIIYSPTAEPEYFFHYKYSWQLRWMSNPMTQVLIFLSKLKTLCLDEFVIVIWIFWHLTLSRFFCYKCLEKQEDLWLSKISMIVTFT